MFAVFHYADNLDIQTNRIAGSEGEMTPDRVSVGEESARHRLIDDGDLLTASRIRVGEFTSAEKRNAHSGEVIGADQVMVDIHVFAFLLLMPFHRHVRTPVAVGKDRDFRGADRTHAGKRRQTCAKIIKKADGSLRGVTVQFGRDGKSDQVVGAYAEIEPLQVVETVCE